MPLSHEPHWPATTTAMGRGFTSRTAIRPLALLPIAALVWADVSLGQEDPKQIVAAAVRQRGFQCSKPESVRSDPDNSSPGEKAWIIRCENASFSVKYMGDTGPKVEPISD